MPKVAAMPTFDVVSEVDIQEVRNALDQALREIGTRFDFKGSDTHIEFDDGLFTLSAEDDFKLGQARDILYLRLAKRGIDMKALLAEPVTAVGSGRARQEIKVRQGIDADAARQLIRWIKDSKAKVQASIQGDQLRISGKKRDDLQEVIALLRKQSTEMALQFVNFRD